MEFPALETNTRVTVPLGPKLCRRFYEPIVLLAGLNKAVPHSTPVATATRIEVTQGPEQSFHCFINKLSQVCDNIRGGPTVTSFTVLQEPDKVVYVFASNRRKQDELDVTKEFIISILQQLGEASIETEGKTREAFTTLLYPILAFNRLRIEFYVDKLSKELEKCKQVCHRGTSQDDPSLLDSLQQLGDIASYHTRSDLSDGEFVRSSETLLTAINHLYESWLGNVIRDRAKEGRMDMVECWVGLRHYAGRLLSLYFAAQDLLYARRAWPELFLDFEVKTIPSSEAAANPMKKKSASANELIGRIMSDPDEIERYRELARELQKCNLDELIRQQCTRTTFKPIAHAEVLVLNWLKTNGYTRPDRFFEGWKYIGASKPTCRLCSYYFHANSDGIQCRPSHGNLYPNWRVCDVYRDQGDRATVDREKVLNGILERIRDDACRTLREKTSDGKRYDSNTYSARLNRNVLGDGSVISGTVSDFNNLSVKSPHRVKPVGRTLPALTTDEGREDADESDDDEDGGASLSAKT